MRPCFQTADASVPTCPWRPAWSGPSSAPTRSGRPPSRSSATTRPRGAGGRSHPSDLPAFRERLAARDIGPVAVHASYLINLAGPEPDFYERSIGLADERAASRPGVRGPVRQRPRRIASRHVRRDGDGAPGRCGRADPCRDRRHARCRATRPRELVRRRVRPRDERRRSSRASPRRSRRAASRTAGSASASTRPTPGAPASTCRDPTRSMRSSPTSTAASGSLGWSWSTSTTRSPNGARARIGTSTSGPG